MYALRDAIFPTLFTFPNSVSKLHVRVYIVCMVYVKLLSLYLYTLRFTTLKNFFRRGALTLRRAYFRVGAYFSDSLASVEKGAYFRGVLTFETPR